MAASQGAPAAQIFPPPPPQTFMPGSGLTVVGEGLVQAEPDIAYVSAGVQTQGQTARQAQDDNTTRMNAVLAAIKARGIAETDIRTSGLGVHPTYDRAPGQISGYIATNTVTVTIRDVRRAGELLDSAITAGANQAGNVRFGLKDDAPLRAKALEQAVRAARARADAIAQAAGLKITGIHAMADESGGGGPIPVEERAMAASVAPADVPIQPGQLSVSGRVRVVFAISP